MSRGGARPGAGRPVGQRNPPGHKAGRPVKRRGLRVGDEFVVVRHFLDGGHELIQLWRVTELSRTLIVFQISDGSEIRMVN